MAVIPTTDVNLATKVRNVLNSAGGSVSDILSTFFSSSAKLNMWSSGSTRRIPRYGQEMER